jgi:hypothetical protein
LPAGLSQILIKGTGKKLKTALVQIFASCSEIELFNPTVAKPCKLQAIKFWLVTLLRISSQHTLSKFLPRLTIQGLSSYTVTNSQRPNQEF